MIFQAEVHSYDWKNISNGRHLALFRISSVQTAPGYRAVKAFFWQGDCLAAKYNFQTTLSLQIELSEYGGFQRRSSCGPIYKE